MEHRQNIDGKYTENRWKTDGPPMENWKTDGKHGKPMETYGTMENL